ncbi:MAG: hypothetical protein ACRDJO_05040 [Actinomycetota bacterium]
MAPDKPHPLGLTADDGKAVTRILQEQRDAEAKANAPKDNRPENVKEIVAKIVEEGRNPQPDPPAGKKQRRFGFLKRG